MKKIIIALLIGLFTIQFQAQNSESTTYYLVRHAEKDRSDKTNRNPELTAQGHSRAENYKTLFKDVSFDFIYSTNYHRTIQTATPTAESKQLEIQFYDPRDLYNASFQSKTKGKSVLIVGHSNTTPQFANKILGADTYKDIDDSNNSNVYIITIIGDQKSAVVLKVEHEK